MKKKQPEKVKNPGDISPKPNLQSSQLSQKGAKNNNQQMPDKEQQNNFTHVYIHDRKRNQMFKYCNNEINTCKYTWWNFFPKSILLQFMRAANMYFLISAIVISIEEISPLSPITAIGPLVLVLACSLIREAIEEHKRIMNDKDVNSQTTLVYNNKKKFKEIKWNSLQVGDVVKVFKNEMFPADLFVMTTSDKVNGMAFVETANLDGERNLKTKTSIDKMHNFFKHHQIASLDTVITCDKPNNNIHQFRGQIQATPNESYTNANVSLNNNNITNQTPQNNAVIANNSNSFKNFEAQFGNQKINFDFPLNNDNLVLRGTILKNVDWIIGTIIYAGKDTKIMKNQGDVRIKISKIEKTMNYLIIGTFFLQQIVQATIAVFAYFDRKTDFEKYDNYEDHYYLKPHGPNTYSPTTTALFSYASYFILLNTFIPISLIVSLEVTKLFQAAFIEFDSQMVYKELNFNPKVINTLIHEQLGEIEYIFTDKTGTLTSNNMIFKGGCVDKFEFTEKELESYIKGHFQKIINSDQDGKHRIFLDYFLCLTLAHDCMYDEDADKANQKNNNNTLKSENNFKSNDTLKIKKMSKNDIDNVVTEQKERYQGSSPDEVCLVQKAYDLGFEFLKRTQNAVFIKLGDNQKVYEFLCKIEFNSDRKKMSLIVKDSETQEITLYTKGADNVILKSLKNRDQAKTDPQQILVRDSLKTFSEDGLRTLCLAKKNIQQEEFDEWYSEYKQSVQFGITDQIFEQQKNNLKQKNKKENVENAPIPSIWQYQDLKTGKWKFYDSEYQDAIEISHQENQEKIQISDEIEIYFHHSQSGSYIQTHEQVYNHEHEKNNTKNIDLPLNLNSNQTNQNKIISKVRRLRTLEFLEAWIEGDLELLGATAVEDKLQVGVPETLLDLQRAGIKVWVLTGDKLETAQNIGYLSNLLTNNSKIYKLSTENRADTLKSLLNINKRLEKCKKKQENIRKLQQRKGSSGQNSMVMSQQQIIKKKEFQRQASKKEIIKQKNFNVDQQLEMDYQNSVQQSRDHTTKHNKNINKVHNHNSNENQVDQSHQPGLSVDLMSRISKAQENQGPKIYNKYDLLIDGKCITHILKSQDNQQEFLKLIPQLSTVICYRSTPTQKAQVVKFVKQNLKKVTLSIGDGGNDVNMIQEADIGVGIIGKEGNQAAQASDYYFGQFRFLWRLLFVHGRLNVKRTAYFINYFFFKNMVFTMCQVWFAYYSRFTAQSFWEDGYLLNFNSLVTAVGPVYQSIYDIDVQSHASKEVHDNMPLLYQETRSQSLFTIGTFARWMIIGTVYSVQIFFITIYAYSNQIINIDGQPDDLWSTSVCAYFATVFVVWAVMFIDTKSYNFITFLCYVIFSFLLFFPIFTFFWSWTTGGALQQRHLDHIGNIKFWGTVVVNTLIPTIFMIISFCVQKFFRPTLADKMQDKEVEARKDPNFKPYYPNYNYDEDQEVDSPIKQQQQENNDMHNHDKQTQNRLPAGSKSISNQIHLQLKKTSSDGNRQGSKYIDKNNNNKGKHKQSIDIVNLEEEQEKVIDQEYIQSKLSKQNIIQNNNLDTENNNNNDYQDMEDHEEIVDIQIDAQQQEIQQYEMQWNIQNDMLQEGKKNEMK